MTFGKPLNIKAPEFHGSAEKLSDTLSVAVENPTLCPRYIAGMVKNVKIGPSPRWMRERLRASGVRPINNLVDITNYVMLEYGQPMHAFDLRYVKDGKIVVRNAKDGETITIEPWRSAAFPVIKDLVVNRSAYDQILQAGGFISVRTNSVPDGNAIPIPKADADESMDAAACVGCGACAATCKNGSAMLFVAARVSSLAKLPQGRVEGARRAKAMVAKMDELGFGNCTNTGACQAECPKAISIAHIARLNREFLSAKFED